MVAERKTSRQIYDESVKVRRQIDDGRPRQTEDDIQREQFGPRGVPGQPDPAKMVPQRKKKTPSSFDPGHTGGVSRDHEQAMSKPVKTEAELIAMARVEL